MSRKRKKIPKNGFTKMPKTKDTVMKVMIFTPKEKNEFCTVIF